MKICFYTIYISIFLLYSCGNKSVIPDGEKVEGLFSEFADSTTIGVKGNNKLVLRQYHPADSCYIDFFEKEDNNWKLLQNFSFDMSPILEAKDAVVQDYNNDGFGDFTYPSFVAARGGNKVQKLFIYSSEKKELVYIHNSENYPNLEYNKDLDCLDAFALYGGSTTLFLHLESDSLKEFAKIDLWDNHRTVVEIDKYGKETVLKEDTIRDGPYIRYKNYKTLEEYTEN